MQITVKTLSGEVVFQSTIVRFALLEGRVSALLAGGFVPIPIVRGGLYSIIIDDGVSPIEKTGEFLSHNFVASSTMQDGQQVVSVTDNSLLFKLF